MNDRPFAKRKPLEGEILCPYNEVPYNEILGYISGYGCPVCKAIGVFHIPILDRNLTQEIKKRIGFSNETHKI